MHRMIIQTVYACLSMKEPFDIVLPTSNTIKVIDLGVHVLFKK